jgi:hypothetical protein
MIRTILRPNFVRQFSHTHSRTIFPENNKKNIEELIRQQNQNIEELIRQQNQQLKDINKNITWACFTLTTSSIAINCIR